MMAFNQGPVFVTGAPLNSTPNSEKLQRPEKKHGMLKF